MQRSGLYVYPVKSCAVLRVGDPVPVLEDR
jgi:uncharacterized protein YcbX